MKRIYTLFLITAVAFATLMPVQGLYQPVLAETTQPQLWAAMVGVTEYQCPLCVFDDEWNIYPVGIKHPDDSARDLAAQLSPIAGDDHIKLVLNEQATNAGIYYAVKWLAEKTKANDTALFFFCGHSAPQYLGSYDYLVSDKQIAEWLDGVHSQKVVVILDTCYAGSFRNELGKNGRIVLMSCQPFESSLEDRELKHTVFTHYILQALSNFTNADTNGNFELSAEEIFDYASPKTADEIVAPFANLSAASNMQHPTLYIPPDVFGEINLFMKVAVDSNVERASDNPVLTVEGKTYLAEELPAVFTWLSGSSHRLDVPLQVDMEDGSRLVFTSWNDDDKSSSRVIVRGGDYIANYRTQYKLTVQSPYGRPHGGGWYDSGQTASVSVDASYGNIIQHTFTGWSGDFNGQSAKAVVTMDKNKTIKANWHNDYLRLYLLIAGIILVVGGITAALKMHRKNLV